MGLFTKNYPPEIAARVPPGQRLVKSWPVLHFGSIPRFDGEHWDLEVSGLVEEPFTLTLPGAAGPAPGDGRCGHALRHRAGPPWTTPGKACRSARSSSGPSPPTRRSGSSRTGRGGYTSNLSFEAMDDDDVLLAWRNHGEDLTARARLAAPTGGAEALRLEEREMAHRPGVQREEPPGVLGGPGLPHPRRALRGGALQLPGRRAGGDAALAGAERVRPGTA